MEPRDDSAHTRCSSQESQHPHAEALADSRRAMLRQRARRIRRSVTLFAAALFSAAFLVVYVQLASGHDPALVADARRAAAQVTAVRSASSAQSASSGEASTPTGTGGKDSATASGEAGESGTSEGESGTSEAAATVTTSQS